jgi:hypothetical protein
MMKFLKDLILWGPLRGLFVELQDINHSLRVFSPFLFRNSAFVDKPLPFFWQTLESVNEYKNKEKRELTVNWPVELS